MIAWRLKPLPSFHAFIIVISPRFKLKTKYKRLGPRCITKTTMWCFIFANRRPLRDYHNSQATKIIPADRVETLSLALSVYMSIKWRNTWRIPRSDEIIPSSEPELVNKGPDGCIISLVVKVIQRATKFSQAGFRSSEGLYWSDLNRTNTTGRLKSLLLKLEASDPDEVRISVPNRAGQLIMSRIIAD